jgi:DNA-binding response OmpR family regulator
LGAGRQSGSILGVLPGHADQACLGGILAQANWKLRLASTFQQFQGALTGTYAGVIVTDADLPERYSWKHVAEAAALLTPPPAVIVVSRLSYDRLWVDVLNFGGFDLLWKPLNPRQVVHSVNKAWRQWCDKAPSACAARAERL